MCSTVTVLALSGGIDNCASVSMETGSGRGFGGKGGGGTELASSDDILNVL